MALVPPLPSAAVLGFPERVAVDRAFDAGRAAWGDVGLERDDFRACVAQRAARCGGTSEEGRADEASEWIHAAALVDLYLASACEAGNSRAWEILTHDMRPRLEGFAARRGHGSFEAESVVQDLLGDLAAPPSRPIARTLLGTFDGSGSLFGWLCVVLLRRIAGAARRRRTSSLEAQDHASIATAVPAVPRTPAVDPAAAAAGVEASARFDRALDEAWLSLTVQERLAILFKHRDGLTQRQIGSLLGVGEARVSRVVGSAVSKLSEGIAPAVPGGIASGDAGLEATLARSLARRIALEEGLSSKGATDTRPGAAAGLRGASPEQGR
jgi:RNA polymerase sigma factor (sigma-70 family)